MTKTRKCLAFVLAFVMALSLICIPGLAYDKKDVYNINKYVAFGDSVASGMNNEVRPLYKQVVDADGNPVLDADGNPTYVEILGSTDYGYVGRVSAGMGLDLHGGGAVSWAHTGMRVKDILHEIKTDAVDYTDDAVYPATFKTTGYDSYRETIRQDIREADLITLNVGSNDIFTSPLTYAAVEYAARLAEGEDMSSQGLIGKINKLLPSLADATADTTSEMGIFGSLLNPAYSGLMEIFLQKCFDGYARLKETYPLLLKELRELNPTAQIITIGVFNPMHALSLTGSSLVTFGELADNVLLPLNSFIARTSAKYGCTYVDVVDVATDSSVHPTDEGYDDMTARILAKLRPITEFKDIALQSPEFQKAIQWAANTRITTGTGEGTFSPNKVVNRAEMLTYLWRLAGEPKVEPGASFVDVKDGDYFADAVAWATELGITKGTTALTFSPYLTCTRAQIVTFLYRYDQATNPDAADAGNFDGFRDVGLGAYFGAPVSWAVETGITKGISSVLFGPLEPCTRAQAVTFLARYVGAKFTPL